MAENTDATFPPESPAALSQPGVTTGLNVGDIEFIVKYIDYTVEQGVLKGWPMVDEVAQRRNRYVQFLNAIAANTPAEVSQ